jgi:hypothetical protein
MPRSGVTFEENDRRGEDPLDLPLGAFARWRKTLSPLARGTQRFVRQGVGMWW